jgi:PAT family beta-lactamase induction signal transducer AmpG
MINIEKYSFLKYFIFGSLYFTEGIEMAIAFVIIPVYFVEKNIPYPIVGLAIGIASIPVIVKFVWGGIVDYYAKYGRKRFIILGGIIFSSSTFLLAFIDPSETLSLFILFMFTSVIGIAFLDVSADAWAIEICQKHDFGKVNGAMFAGQYSGMAVGSSALGIIAIHLGYPWVFGIAGLILFIIILFPLFVSETIRFKKRQKVASLVIQEFKKFTTQLVGIFAVFLDVNRGLLLVVVPLYMKVVLSLDIAQIGIIIAIFPITSAFGSIIGGLIADKITRKISLYIFIIGSMLFSAGLIFASSWETLAILYGIIGFLQGSYMTAAGAMFMDVTNPRIGATQFSIFMGLGNGGMTLGDTLSGTLVSFVGFTGTFLYSAWFFGPSLLVLYLIRYERNKRKK